MNRLLPDLSILHLPAVQVLLVSRLLSTAGTKTLTYGAMVHTARIGGSQLEITLLSVSGAVAALMFGIRGGSVADSFPKRVALGVSCAAQAALCFIVPTYLGTGVMPLLLLVFLVSILTQITNPALKASVAIVATTAGVATVTVLLGAASGIGSAAGTAVLVPVLVKHFDIRILMYVSGILLGLASIRAFRLPGERRRTPREPKGKRGGPKVFGFRDTSIWMLRHHAVTTMILAGAAVDILSDVFDTLQPVYVRSVLHADPANAIYIFAPGAVGALLGTLAATVFSRWSGERWLTAVAVAAFSLAMLLFGLIDVVSPVLAPYSPLRLLERFGIHLSDAILAAGLLAILVEFATASATTGVQTYINQRVPIAAQGTTFGMQSFLSNGLSIMGMLAVGVLATVIGTRLVFLVSPPLVAFVLIWLIRSSYRAVDEEEPTRKRAFASLWEEPADDVAAGAPGRRAS